MQLKLFKKIEDTDWARLAAYIDSEGSIFIRITSSKRPWHELRVCVTNIDPRLLLWCRDTFQIGCVARHGKKSAQRPCFEWIVSGSRAAAILEGCLPYFVIKKEQAEIGIAFQRTKSRRYAKVGVPALLLRQRQQMLSDLKKLKHVPLEHYLHKPN